VIGKNEFAKKKPIPLNNFSVKQSIKQPQQLKASQYIPVNQVSCIQEKYNLIN